MRDSTTKSGTREQGFTIAEVLLVVLIIGLIAGSGTGLYVGTFKKLRVQRAAYDFFLTAQYARIMAIERASQYKMQLDTSGHAFLLTTLQWDEQGEQAAEQVVRDPYCRPVQFEGDVVFEDVQIVPINLDTETDAESEDQQTVVFSPDGTAQTAVVQIGNGKAHYTVSISAATGRAKIYYGTTENVKSTSTDLDAES
jgi:prepilin-type N-terminal cleavage/methylation domain-containing protein